MEGLDIWALVVFSMVQGNSNVDVERFYTQEACVNALRVVKEAKSISPEAPYAKALKAKCINDGDFKNPNKIID